MKMELFFRELLLHKGASLRESVVAETTEGALWHCTVVDASEKPQAGGFAADRNLARRIALAEYLERLHVASLRTSDSKIQQRWGMHLIPTACGFAAGFNRSNTIIRSIHEAAERWVMSKWIDENYWIEEISSSSTCLTLDAASKFFAAPFREIRFFKKTIMVNTGSKLLPVTVGQTLGLTDGGIFPGSSAQFSNGNLWQHALLESFRHYLISKNNKGPFDRFPENRIKFFSDNKGAGLDAISRATKKEWPSPEAILHHAEGFNESTYYIARTIFSGWQSWHEGPVGRFVY